jgi:excisionase family DNA binding protein
MGELIPFPQRTPPEPYLSRREAAVYLGVSVRTLERWTSDLGMPARKVGGRWLYRRSELDAWVDGEPAA